MVWNQYKNTNALSPNVSNVIKVEFVIKSKLANVSLHGNNINTKCYIQTVMTSFH